MLFVPPFGTATGSDEFLKNKVNETKFIVVLVCNNHGNYESFQQRASFQKSL